MKTNHRYMLLIVFVFLVSRLWAWSIGVRFDNYKDVDIIQLLPPQAMKENLWQTLIYDHAQPPIFSLMMHLTGMNNSIVHILWIIAGMFATFALYSIGLSFGIMRLPSLAFAILWSVFPSSILFENIPTYDYPTACLLIFAAWALSRGKMLTFSLMLMLVCLTRSAFHPAWMFGSLIIGSVELKGECDEIQRSP